MPTSLLQVKGIGKATAEKLARAGIPTAEDLASMSPEQLAALPGFRAFTAKQIIANARELLTEASEPSATAQPADKPAAPVSDAPGLEGDAAPLGKSGVAGSETGLKKDKPDQRPGPKAEREKTKKDKTKKAEKDKPKKDKEKKKKRKKDKQKKDKLKKEKGKKEKVKKDKKKTK